MTDPRRLIDAYLDGELAPGQEAELAAWLASDPRHVRAFVRETHAHRQLRDFLVGRGLEAEPSTAEAAEARAARRPGRRRGRRWGAARAAARKPNRFALGVAAAAAVLVAALVWMKAGTNVGRNDEPPQVAGRKPSPGDTSPAALPAAVLATLARAEGEVFLQTGPSKERAGTDRPLRAGQVLVLGDAPALAAVVFPDRTRLELAAGSTLRLDAPVRVWLERGTLAADVAPPAAGHAFAVQTPHGEAKVVGTRFTLEVKTDATRLDVQDGVVALSKRDGKESVVVTAGHHAVAAAGVPLAVSGTAAEARNLLREPDFSGGVGPEGARAWRFYTSKNLEDNRDLSIEASDGALHLSMPGVAGADCTVYQSFDFVPGQEYLFAFRIWAESEGTVYVHAIQDDQPWSHCGLSETLPVAPGATRLLKVYWKANEIGGSRSIRVSFGGLRGRIRLSDPMLFAVDAGDRTRLEERLRNTPGNAPPPGGERR